MGIRPTFGLTSRSLVVPFSEHQDTVGPMAKTVKDVAYVLQAIAGKDASDNYTSVIPFSSVPNYVEACNISSLVGKRIGIPRNAILSEFSSGFSLAAFEAAIAVLKQAGAIIVDNANFTLPVLVNADASTADNTSSLSITATELEFIIGVDFATNLPQYLSQLTSNPQNVYSVADITNFTRNFKPEEYPDRNTDSWDRILAAGDQANNTTPEFWTIYQSVQTVFRRGGVAGVLANHSLDALILPSRFAPGIPSVGGTPVISVPMGSFGPSTMIETDDRGLVYTAPGIP